LRAMVDKSLIEVYNSWRDSYRQYERQTDRRPHQNNHHQARGHSNAG
jgi:hypothetical protein